MAKMRSRRELLKPVKDKRRKRILAKSAVVLASVIVILLSSAYLLGQEGLLISEVKVEGNLVLEKEEVAVVVRRKLAGRYLSLFKKSNSWIYPKGKIEEALIESFPRIKNLELDRDGLRSLIVRLVERRPAYLWCQEGTGGCSFLDDEGVAFASAPTFSDNVYFTFVSERLDGELFGKIVALKKYLSDLLPEDTSLTKAIFLEHEDVELWTETGWKIIFNLGQESDRLVAYFDTLVHSPEIKIDFNNLSYIDLRFGRKIFYK